MFLSERARGLGVVHMSQKVFQSITVRLSEQPRVSLALEVYRVGPGAAGRPPSREPVNETAQRLDLETEVLQLLG